MEQQEEAGKAIAYLFVINYAWESIRHNKPSLIGAGFCGVSEHCTTLHREH